MDKGSSDKFIVNQNSHGFLIPMIVVEQIARVVWFHETRCTMLDYSKFAVECGMTRFIVTGIVRPKASSVSGGAYFQELRVRSEIRSLQTRRKGWTVLEWTLRSQNGSTLRQSSFRRKLTKFKC